MDFRVENKPVSRRQFYATLIGVLTFVEFVVRSATQSEAFRTRLEVFVVVALLLALIELIRTR